MRTTTALFLLVALGCGDPGGDTLTLGPAEADPRATSLEAGAAFVPGARIDVGGSDAERTVEPDPDYPIAMELRGIETPGDLDGDGYPDALVWGAESDRADRVCDDASGEDVCHFFERAVVRVVYGGGDLQAAMEDTPVLESWHVFRLRHGVSPAGDVDGDGRADFLLGVGTFGCEQGQAFLVYGSDRLEGTADVRDRGALFREREECTYYGAVAGLGDVDADGYDDFAIGAPGAGRLYLHYGGPERFEERGDESTADAYLVGPAPSEVNPVTGFGAAAPAGDVNGDGHADFFAFGRMPAGGDAFDAVPGTTELHLVLGGPRLAGEVALASAAIPLPSSTDGSPVALGDLDSDGFDDFGVPIAGGVAFFLGRAELPARWEVDDAVRLEGTGGEPGRRLVVAKAGDVNGDARLDVLVGDPTDGLGGTVHLLLGDADGPSWDDALAFHGRSRTRSHGDRLGDGLGRVQVGVDLDADGLSDLIFAGVDRRPLGPVLYLWRGR